MKVYTVSFRWFVLFLQMLMNAVVSHVKTLVSTHRGLIIVLVKVDTGSCPTDNVKVCGCTCFNYDVSSVIFV